MLNIYFLLTLMFLVRTVTILRTKCYKRTVGKNKWRQNVSSSVYKVIFNTCADIVDKTCVRIITKKARFWQFCLLLTHLCFYEDLHECSCMRSLHGRQNIGVAAIKLGWIWVSILYYHTCSIDHIKPRWGEVHINSFLVSQFLYNSSQAAIPKFLFSACWYPLKCISCPKRKQNYDWKILLAR